MSSLGALKRHAIFLLFVVCASFCLYVVVYAASSGPNSPGTIVDDTSIGTSAWSTASNAGASDDARASVDVCNGAVNENSIKIVKGGTIVGTDKANTGTELNTTDTYVSYGGSSDLWGTTWTPSDINASNFGVAVSYQGMAQGVISHYLKATNFGFSIPDGATIVGIVVEIEGREVTGVSCGP